MVSFSLTHHLCFMFHCLITPPWFFIAFYHHFVAFVIVIINVLWVQCSPTHYAHKTTRCHLGWTLSPHYTYANCNTFNIFGHYTGCVHTCKFYFFFHKIWHMFCFWASLQLHRKGVHSWIFIVLHWWGWQVLCGEGLWKWSCHGAHVP